MDFSWSPEQIALRAEVRAFLAADPADPASLPEDTWIAAFDDDFSARLGARGWIELAGQPGTGSDLAALDTCAEPRGDTFVIRGQKTRTSFAESAEYCCSAPVSFSAHRGGHVWPDETSATIVRFLRALTR